VNEQDHIIGHFGDESLQSVTCTGIDKPRTTNRTEHVQNTNQCNPQNGPKQQYKALKAKREDRQRMV